VILTDRGSRLLAAALGINLWATMVVVPALHLGAALRSPVVLGVLSALGAGVLVAGVLLRSRITLLTLFPLTLVAALAFDPTLAGPSVYTPATLLPCAVALILHFGGSLLFLGTTHAPKAPLRLRPLPPTTPTRAQSRGRRVCHSFTALAAIMPLGMLGALHYRPSAARDLATSFGANLELGIALLDLFVLALWAGVFVTYFAGPLRIHLEGDRLTMAENLLVASRLRQRPSAALIALLLAAAVGLFALFLGRSW
jgi:hypothetical protein